MALVKRYLAKAGDDRGAELIELALILPLLLIVAAGIMEFGFLFQRSEVITNAVREGARIAALPGYTAGNVDERVRNYLTASGLTCDGACAITLAYEDEYLSSATVRVARVSIDFPVPSVILSAVLPLVGGTAYGSIVLHAASVMRVEG